MTVVYRMKTFRVARVSERVEKAITEPAEAAALVRRLYETLELDADCEHVVLLVLDTRNVPIGYKVVCSGGMDGADVDARVVFRSALLLGGAKVIVAHNHPSGVVAPSEEDRAVTRRLAIAGKALDMPLVDHIVLGSGDNYHSFVEAGMLEIEGG